jgi:hypothetical protein
VDTDAFVRESVFYGLPDIQEFVKPIHRDMLIVDHCPENLLNSLARYEAPQTDKWIGRD